MEIKEIIKRVVGSSRLEYCAICGKCLSVCPTYRELGLELHSPRGRLSLIYAYTGGELGEVGKKFYEALDWCLLCSACETVCPAKIRPAEALMYARALPEFRSRQSRIEKFILKKMVTNQARLAPLSLLLRLGQQLGITEIMRRSKLQELLPLRLKVMQDLLPPELGKGISRRVRHLPPLKVSEQRVEGLRIKFFLGCAMNILLPDVVVDTIRLLGSVGCTLSWAREFYCCGAPHLHEGDYETALALVKINIKMLFDDEMDVISSDCDSCVAMLRKYAELLKETELEIQAQKVSKCALTLSELLVKIGIKRFAFQDFGGVRVCWDDPCELIHAQQVNRQPREILKDLPGVELRELPEADWCCGCAGAYVLKHPELAEKILQRKIAAIRSTDVDVVLTSNPGCLLQLSYGVRHSGESIQVKHLSTFLARNLRDDYNRAEAR